ncbi:Rad7 putative isoform 1 [Tripterygium wilfordii]|uniref:Rad7 putative isoform 1 n=1 Tax=Tripterygium wilfordii TaxID=458696 RepID=A0A7J7BW73_TRIWF|nr:DNA repair protein RAD7-like [Tripterygium wilfordii]KAF5726133.1 Rad7 putative isoform 1 [Tripterygium wilfordii]
METEDDAENAKAIEESSTSHRPRLRNDWMDLDLNVLAEEARNEIQFQDHPEKQTENGQLGHNMANDGFLNLDVLAEDALHDIALQDHTRFSGRFPEKQTEKDLTMRYTSEEKGKAKIDDDQVLIETNDGKTIIVLDSDDGEDEIKNEDTDNLNLNLGLGQNVDFMELDLVNDGVRENTEPAEVEPPDGLAWWRAWQKELRLKAARRLALPKKPKKQIDGKPREKILPPTKVDDETSDSPFSMAMEAIEKRNSVRKPQFKWVPNNNKGSSNIKRGSIPSLLELSLNALAENSEAIVSLKFIPDALRHKLSQRVCDSRKMDAQFFELLTRESPTEIRVKNCSQITEEELTRIFLNCDTQNLTVLQLDFCGQCVPDHVLENFIARSQGSLPSLLTISLRGALRLTDAGLPSIGVSAPALQSINLSQCSFLTFRSINLVKFYFESSLRELYIDDCMNIDAMRILPSLKKLKHLQVLSVAGIETVSDDFVIGIVEAIGRNLRELVFANCVALTDISVKFIGENCSKLYSLDLSYLDKLTDSAVKYLANGCCSIGRLNFCRNGFSDEAIAAFLEVSGRSLHELSLNNVRMVGINTAISIVKYSKNLWTLDLSWCRKLSDEALGSIVDSCESLRLLKLFGCSQITNAFLEGHSNSLVQIVGLQTTPALAHLDSTQIQQTPLRYPPLPDHQILDQPDS